MAKTTAAKKPKGKRRPRSPVGSPLDPASLHAMGALKAIPPPPPGFDVSGAWTQTWRIWTCYGYRESGNMNAGFLRIQRVAEGAPFTMKVAQELVTPDRVVHRIDATMQCEHNRLSTPVGWTLSSRFRGGGHKEPPETATREKVTVKARTLEIEAGGDTLKRPISRQWTSDWSLFEAIQRLPFRSDMRLSFDVLEGLSLLKQGHTLRYKGRQEAELGGEAATLHRFHQVGRGVLPYEYWLDRHHRLVLVVTGYRTYILGGRS